jgi:hypothetical protein
VTRDRLHYDRPVPRHRSVVLCVALAAVLAGCVAEPTLQPSPARTAAPTNATASRTATAAPSATATASPVATGSPSPSAADWPGRIVIRYADGSFALASADGQVALAMPAGDWWLGTGSAEGLVLVFPVEKTEVDAALVAIAADGSASLNTRIGEGRAIAGSGCLSSTGQVALFSLLDGALTLLEGAERREIEVVGHGSVGECAWLADQALVTPSNHDHALLHVHGGGAGHERSDHGGPFEGVHGRYPSTGDGRLSLTTGDADDEGITVWDVSETSGDGTAPPELRRRVVLRPGDGPRRGLHALSPDGRWLAAAGLDGDEPTLWIQDLTAVAPEAAAAVALEQPADSLVFLADPAAASRKL